MGDRQLIPRTIIPSTSSLGNKHSPSRWGSNIICGKLLENIKSPQHADACPMLNEGLLCYFLRRSEPLKGIYSCFPLGGFWSLASRVPDLGKVYIYMLQPMKLKPHERAPYRPDTDRKHKKTNKGLKVSNILWERMIVKILILPWEPHIFPWHQGAQGTDRLIELYFILFYYFATQNSL